MDLKLEGKRALVTGSSSGIGIGIARRLAAEGARVVVHGRDPERVQSVTRAINDDGGRASAVVADLATDAGAARVAADALAALGGIDILVNNAASVVGPPNGAWLEASADDWAATYHTTVLSAVRLIQALTPGMKARGWGRIIQISSTGAAFPTATNPQQFAAKAGLSNLTVGLTKALIGTGITVNTVSPGPIMTPAFKSYLLIKGKQAGWGEDWEVIQRKEAELRNLPAGRFGDIDDIGSAVAYIASPLAGFICGANLRIDGGWVGVVN